MPGKAAFGTQLLIGGTAGTAVANVTQFEGPGLSADVLDMGSHDSPGSYAEKAVGRLDAGEVTMRLNFDPNSATHKNAIGGLRYLFAQRASSSFALKYPVTPVAHDIFTAYVTAFSATSPHDDKLEASVTLTITGEPTLA